MALSASVNAMVGENGSVEFSLALFELFLNGQVYTRETGQLLTYTVEYRAEPESRDYCREGEEWLGSVWQRGYAL